MTIKVVSVNGKRMSKAIYSQLPRRSPFDHDSSVRGRLWGVVVDPKCCHSMRTAGREHWHVVYECEGELAVWGLRQGAENAPYNLIAGGPYEPRSRVDREFLDSCALETHRGSTDFFEGRLFDLVRDDQVVAMIEDTKVYLSCSAAVLKLRTTRTEHHTAVQRAASLRRFEHAVVPDYVTEAAAKAEKELGAAEEVLERLRDQRERGIQDLYADLVVDVRRIKQARENYAVALKTVEQLPQLFLGA
ncbi:hypothetical protein [Streptomyces sp. NBC_00989]|uniref:hypothetical protein n=1 Tax=Streptomyces sp. NBC_00989 TaxID=2903705 RepID=UPI0038684CEE|nr:hypothetical protein OG714_54225 [Streptomyces sp. NBC_00989]